MDDEKLMQEIDAAYMRAKHGKAYLGDEMGKAIASGQKASHAANEWMMLRAEARKRGLIPDLGLRADLAQAPAPVRETRIPWGYCEHCGCGMQISDDGLGICGHGRITQSADLVVKNTISDAGRETGPACTTPQPGEVLASSAPAPDAGVVAELVEALRKFEAHYPRGINPFLDEAHSKARAILAKLETRA